MTETISIGLNGMKAKLLTGCEAYGGDGSMGWHLYGDLNGEEFDREDVRLAHKAMEELFEKIKVRHTKKKLENPAHEKAVLKAKFIAEARSVFLDAGLTPALVEEIPNGYCAMACCLHRPWLVVTTPVGRIEVGWRKRVLNIDWSRSKVEALATALFNAENVSMGERWIHAWNYADAARYLRILAAFDRAIEAAK